MESVCKLQAVDCRLVTLTRISLRIFKNCFPVLKIPRTESVNELLVEKLPAAAQIEILYNSRLKTSFKNSRYNNNSFTMIISAGIFGNFQNFRENRISVSLELQVAAYNPPKTNILKTGPPEMIFCKF